MIGKMESKEIKKWWSKFSKKTLSSTLMCCLLSKSSWLTVSSQIRKMHSNQSKIQPFLLWFGYFILKFKVLFLIAISIVMHSSFVSRPKRFLYTHHKPIRKKMVGFSFCGISSFPREDEGEHKIVPSTKISIRRKSSGGKKDKNPCAARGLKQFCALLAEIEEKRQKIYCEVGAEAISLIQFVYSDDNKCKPIVVRVKKGDNDKEVSRSPFKPDHVLGSSLVVGNKTAKNLLHLKHGYRNEDRSSFLRCLTLERLRVDHCYKLPLIVIVILFLLVFFERSAAVFCISMGWYLVPQITSNQGSNLRKPVQKKDGVRREMLKKKKILGGEFSSFKVRIGVKSFLRVLCMGRAWLGAIPWWNCAN